ncbi:MAG: hypothetical protein V4620_05390 [Bacteroidota bacterium]
MLFHTENHTPYIVLKVNKQNENYLVAIENSKLYKLEGFDSEFILYKLYYFYKLKHIIINKKALKINDDFDLNNYLVDSSLLNSITTKTNEDIFREYFRSKVINPDIDDITKRAIIAVLSSRNFICYTDDETGYVVAAPFKYHKS